MFDSALIDIAIGLSLVFLMFSLLVSAVSEIVAALVGLRARYLFDGIAKLLQSEEARDALYNHPLIRGLSASVKIAAPHARNGSDGPSYIPSRTFALALLDILGKTTIASTNPALKTSLGALVDDAAGNIDRLRENVEIWFNDGMDRVSGLYKRHSMWTQFAIAMVLAVALNVDSLLIARALWREPTLRQVLVNEGASLAERPLPTPGSPDARYDVIKQQIEGLGLPIGWECGDGPVPAMTRPFWCKGGGALGDRSKVEYFWSVLAVALGWLITGAAASLGAPFWFDMLKRIVSIRSAGKAPEERPLPPKEVSQPREPGQRPIDADILNALSKAKG